MALNKETTSIEVGATETLIATVLPERASDKSVSWDSSDDTVATVDSGGKVSGVAEGTATITVTTTDGEETDTCSVTVTEADEETSVTSDEPHVYTQAELEAMTKEQITTLATELEYTLDGITSSSTKADIIAAFLAAQTAAE